MPLKLRLNKFVQILTDIQPCYIADSCIDGLMFIQWYNVQMTYE